MRGNGIWKKNTSQTQTEYPNDSKERDFLSQFTLTTAKLISPNRINRQDIESRDSKPRFLSLHWHDVHQSHVVTRSSPHVYIYIYIYIYIFCRPTWSCFAWSWFGCQSAGRRRPWSRRTLRSVVRWRRDTSAETDCRPDARPTVDEGVAVFP